MKRKPKKGKRRRGRGRKEGNACRQTPRLKTCVRQRTQRLICPASRTILTCVDQRFVSYWEVMYGTWHASYCSCCLFWSTRFTLQCKSIFFNFFWNAKLFLRLYKGFRSFNLFSKVSPASEYLKAIFFCQGMRPGEGVFLGGIFFGGYVPPGTSK